MRGSSMPPCYCSATLQNSGDAYRRGGEMAPGERKVQKNLLVTTAPLVGILSIIIDDESLL